MMDVRGAGLSTDDDVVQLLVLLTRYWREQNSKTSRNDQTGLLGKVS